MTATTIGTAVEKRDNSPRGLIEQYSSDFATVLPSHIKPETWVRVAQGALKKGKKQGDKFELEIAATNNPAAFLSALLDAARQGLEPGSEQYYLTPRKVKGQLEILGIRGYQGEIELMYRAGAVSSVIVECVRAIDKFSYVPGRDAFPVHEIDWDADDRGALRLVYAYARMKDGAYSKVVVLNKSAISKIRAVSQGADSEYSPWTKWEESMWMKSAAHQLRKWVPTSSEYLTQQARAAGTVLGAAAAERARGAIASPPLRAEVELGANPNMNGDQIMDAQVVDDDPPPPGINRNGEMADPDAWPVTAQPPGALQSIPQPDEPFFADMDPGR